MNTIARLVTLGCMLVFTLAGCAASEQEEEKSSTSSELRNPGGRCYSNCINRGLSQTTCARCWTLSARSSVAPDLDGEDGVDGSDESESE